MNGIPFSPWEPFPQGEHTQPYGWQAILPDPMHPGKFRLVEFTIEYRMELKGEVDAKGNPIVDPAKAPDAIAK